MLHKHLKTIAELKKLDLCFSVNPIEWLSHRKILAEIIEQKGDVSINISYCTFSDELQKNISSLIKSFPDISWIFYSWKKKDLAVAKEFSQGNPFCHIQIKEVIDELSLKLPQSLSDHISQSTQEFKLKCTSKESSCGITLGLS